MKKSKIASMLLVLALMFSMSTGVFAVNYDLTNIETNEEYDFETWTFDDDVIVDTTYSGGNYTLELNEKQYKVDEIISEMYKGKTLDEAVKVLNPVGQEELKVESISAINSTQVEVVFNQAVEGAKVENFQIESLEVKGLSHSEDNKTVILETGIMKYDKEYKVVVKDLLKEDYEGVFTSKEVSDLWTLKIKAPEAMKADGISTEVVKFSLLGEDGEVDTEANDIVLDLNATYGNLSQKRLTIQNGVGEVILRSEFQESEVKSKIDAQIIDAEAGSIYKDLIGKIVAEPAYVLFNHEGTGSGEQALIKSLKSVNSNEADRVTLIFNEEITEKEIFKFDEKGNMVINKDTNLPELLNNIKVSQDAPNKDGVLENSLDIKGVQISPKNSKALIVFLDVRNAKSKINKDNILKDNKDVYVSAKIGKHGSDEPTSFKLTDARTPNLTSAEAISNKKLKVSFSEGILSTNFIIDGRFNSETFEVKFGDLIWSSKTKQYDDLRNQATITLNEKYQESDGDKNYTAGYFKPGKHAIQASTIKDFAAATDSENIGTTQSLSFDVEEDNTKIEVVQYVDSPEQFRVKFNKDVVFKNNESFGNVVEFKFKGKNKDDKEDWIKVVDNIGKDKHFKSKFESGVTISGQNDLLIITDLKEYNGDNEYLVELEQDWTKIYNTSKTNDNYYNDEFALVLPKGTVKTVANGKTNDKDIILNLTDGTVLAAPDTTSPEIAKNGIEKSKDFNENDGGGFDVTMTEPVKLLVDKKVINKENATLAQNQSALPETKVEFIGKDKDGKVRTLPGTVEKFADELDKVIYVKWAIDEVVTPQTIVNNGGDTDWTLVIKSISDDVGNTAPTATQTFKLKATKPSEDEFIVKDTDGSAIGEDGETNEFCVSGSQVKSVTGDVYNHLRDEVEITFNQPVSVTGVGSATDVKNYTLNGNALPKGTSIVITNKDDKVITIKLPKGTLTEPTSVITLAGQLKSNKGTEITGDLAFTFKVVVKIEEPKE